MTTPAIESERLGGVPPQRPLIVGIGGTMRADSTCERTLLTALRLAEAEGAEVRAFTGRAINFPMYQPDDPVRTAGVRDFIDALRGAHGVILASPGYHGTISGLVKNALDYVEDMRADEAVYLEGRACGLIVCAAGWQATGSTLGTLRSVVHALRAWPTPLAVTVNSAEQPMDGATLELSLRILARQVVEFARMRARHADELVASTR